VADGHVVNEPIFETVVTTRSPEGRLHVAPMGVRYRGATVVLMPFRPSTTLDNILATRRAVLNLLTDVRVFAGCVTGRRRDWPVVDLAGVAGLNRAQAAVLEGAVLASRLHLLPRDKIDAELAYLQIAIDKTAGEAEHEAWRWVTDAVAAHRAATGSACAASTRRGSPRAAAPT
jgi:uncharacterized protein